MRSPAPADLTDRVILQIRDIPTSCTCAWYWLNRQGRWRISVPDTFCAWHRRFRSSGPTAQGGGPGIRSPLVWRAT
jgi:hypothetical protein